MADTPKYYLNGIALTKENGLLPSRRDVDHPTPEVIDTLGGQVEVEPPTGLRMTVVWHYDGREAYTLYQLKTILAGSNQCTITCPDTYRDAAGNDIMITNLRCLVRVPTLSTDGSRKWIGNFSLTFTQRQGE